jgi:hypothetical protein
MLVYRAEPCLPTIQCWESLDGKRNSGSRYLAKKLVRPVGSAEPRDSPVDHPELRKKIAGPEAFLRLTSG